MKKEESSAISKCQNLQCSAIANDLEVTDEMIWKEFETELSYDRSRKSSITSNLMR